MSRWKVLAAAVAALGVSAATAGQAAAHGGLTCELRARTTSVSPPMQFVGGAGSLSFSGSGTCNDTGVAGPASVSGSGTYSNVVCLTGTVQFAMTVTTYRSHTVTASATLTAGSGPMSTTHGGVPGSGWMSMRPALDNNINPPGQCTTVGDIALFFTDTPQR